ncbi:hypothetical protein TA3x_002022 [Tundrisphaera sp. TA3]|uniref:hypothetical protein n=1 Tax=Tundrisphaera sp. TA3 TaxID=3435775 RepID=UPI003EBBA32E
MDLAYYKQVAAELSALDAKVNDLLPPRYQHCYSEVSPTSMGSAGLVYGPDGKVAWDRIWTTFCDLALAGGPPHRGKLLEPPTGAEAAAEPDRYAEVVAEIGRAIGLTTGLATVEEAPGWVGVPCRSPAEAAWLQFAVTAENVSARRRGAVLLLPAGPGFRAEKEIKNVVVALAKACHYWEGHLTESQQALAGEDAWEPASPAEAAANRPDYDESLDQVLRAVQAAGRPASTGRYVGWAGVQAEDEEEAVWLLRAVLAERVLARREDAMLYLPVAASPDEVRSARIGRALEQACRLWAAYSARLRPR